MLLNRRHIAQKILATVLARMVVLAMAYSRPRLDFIPTWSARLEVIDLANLYALCNFLATFSGTHDCTPRTRTGHIGFDF